MDEADEGSVEDEVCTVGTVVDESTRDMLRGDYR